MTGLPIEKLRCMVSNVSSVGHEDINAQALKEILQQIFEIFDLIKSTGSQMCEREVHDSLEFLSIINNVADTSPAVKSEIVMSCLGFIFELITQEDIAFGFQVEVLKLTNVLLENCPNRAKETLLTEKNFEKLLVKFGKQLDTVGDYEYQVGLIECLFRIIPKKIREKYGKLFFKSLCTQKQFLDIRDQDFETDCRLFLNKYNQNNCGKQRVKSIPCNTAYLGDRELRKPNDPDYDLFWVDFNYGSKRLTIFCEEYGQNISAEEAWETISVWSNDVECYAITPKDCFDCLQIELANSIPNLYPSQADVLGKYAKFTFDSSLKVKEAALQTFGYDKIFKQTSYQKVSLPVTSLCVRTRNSPDFEPESEYSSNDEDSKREHPTQSKFPVPSSTRVKVSVPFAPVVLLDSSQASSGSTGMEPVKAIAMKYSKYYQETQEDLSEPGDEIHAEVDSGIGALQKTFSSPTLSKVSEPVSSVKIGSKKKLKTLLQETTGIPTPKTPSTKSSSKVKVKTPVVVLTPFEDLKQRKLRRSKTCVTKMSGPLEKNGSSKHIALSESESALVSESCHSGFKMCSVGKKQTKRSSKTMTRKASRNGKNKATVKMRKDTSISSSDKDPAELPFQTIELQEFPANGPDNSDLNKQKSSIQHKEEMSIQSVVKRDNFAFSSQDSLINEDTCKEICSMEERASFVQSGMRDSQHVGVEADNERKAKQKVSHEEDNKKTHEDQKLPTENNVSNEKISAKEACERTRKTARKQSKRNSNIVHCDNGVDVIHSTFNAENDENDKDFKTTKRTSTRIKRSQCGKNTSKESADGNICDNEIYQKGSKQTRAIKKKSSRKNPTSPNRCNDKEAVGNELNVSTKQTDGTDVIQNINSKKVSNSSKTKSGNESKMGKESNMSGDSNGDVEITHAGSNSEIKSSTENCGRRLSKLGKKKVKKPNKCADDDEVNHVQIISDSAKVTNENHSMMELKQNATACLQEDNSEKTGKSKLHKEKRDLSSHVQLSDDMGLDAKKNANREHCPSKLKSRCERNLRKRNNDDNIAKFDESDSEIDVIQSTFDSEILLSEDKPSSGLTQEHDIKKPAIKSTKKMKNEREKQGSVSTASEIITEDTNGVGGLDAGYNEKFAARNKFIAKDRQKEKIGHFDRNDSDDRVVRNTTIGLREDNVLKTKTSVLDANSEISSEENVVASLNQRKFFKKRLSSGTFERCDIQSTTISKNTVHRNKSCDDIGTTKKRVFLTMAYSSLTMPSEKGDAGEDPYDFDRECDRSSTKSERYKEKRLKAQSDLKGKHCRQKPQDISFQTEVGKLTEKNISKKDKSRVSKRHSLTDNGIHDNRNCMPRKCTGGKRKKSNSDCLGNDRLGIYNFDNCVINEDEQDYSMICSQSPEKKFSSCRNKTCGNNSSNEKMASNSLSNQQNTGVTDKSKSVCKSQFKENSIVFDNDKEYDHHDNICVSDIDIDTDSPVKIPHCEVSLDEVMGIPVLQEKDIQLPCFNCHSKQNSKRARCDTSKDNKAAHISLESDNSLSNKQPKRKRKSKKKVLSSSENSDIAITTNVKSPDTENQHRLYDGKSLAENNIIARFNQICKKIVGEQEEDLETTVRSEPASKVHTSNKKKSNQMKRDDHEQNLTCTFNLKRTPKSPCYYQEDLEEICSIKTPMTLHHSDFDESEDGISHSDDIQILSLKKTHVKSTDSKSKCAMQKTESSNLNGLVSGYSTEVRPSRSSLKRKYECLESDNDSSQTTEDIEMDQQTTDNNLSGCHLRPRRLFSSDLKAIVKITTESDDEEKETVSDKYDKDSFSHASLEQTHRGTLSQLDSGLGTDAGISTVIKAFGLDFQKQMKDKQRSIEVLAKTALKTSQKHMNYYCKDLALRRANIINGFEYKLKKEVEALSRDVKTLEQSESKIMDFFEQQMKVFHNCRVSQERSLENLKTMQMGLTASMEYMNQYEVEKQKMYRDVMKRELATMEKKILTDAQRKELMTVRRSLQSMIG